MKDNSEQTPGSKSLVHEYSRLFQLYVVVTKYKNYYLRESITIALQRKIHQQQLYATSQLYKIKSHISNFTDYERF